MAGVVSVVEPVEPPVAAVFEAGGETVALGPRRDASVALAGQALAKLRGTPVKDAHTAAGYLKVELVAGEVAASVGGLDDHGLASDGAGGEGQPFWDRVSLFSFRVVGGHGGHTCSRHSTSWPHFRR